MRLANWLSIFNGLISRKPLRQSRKFRENRTTQRDAEVAAQHQAEPLEERTLLSGEPVVIEIATTTEGSQPSNFAVVNGVTFFCANDGTSGFE